MTIKGWCSIAVLVAFACGVSPRAATYHGLVQNQNGAAQTRFTVLIDGVPVSTNDDGRFDFPARASTSSVSLGLADSTLAVFFPPGGRIPLTIDTAWTITVLVVEKSQLLSRELDYALLGGLFHQVKAIEAKRFTQDSLLLRDFVDLVSAQRISGTSVDSTMLREAIQSYERRLSCFTQLTELLNGYLRRALDLRDAFDNLISLAVHNRAALDELVRGINTYNLSFGTLFDRRQALLQQVADAWHDRFIESQFSQLLSYLLDDIHVPYFLAYNDLIRELNDTLLSKSLSKSARSDKERQLVERLRLHNSALSSRLRILETRVGEVLVTLQHQL